MSGPVGPLFCFPMMLSRTCQMAPFSLSLALALGLMFAGWLVPNHYWPWVSFHAEALTGLGLALVLIATWRRCLAPADWPLLAVAALGVAVVPILQAGTSLIFFWGDAWMAVLYLAGLAFAIVSGRTLVEHYGAATTALLWSATAVIAIVSAGIGLYQWLELSGLGAFTVEMPPHGRPFGNFAQPNHLATALVLGVVALCALRQQRLLGRGGFALGVAFLCFGVAMTGSRTAWLEVTVLVAWLIAIRARAGLVIRRGSAAAIGLTLAFCVASWPWVSGLMSFDIGRSLAEQARAGTRFVHWSSMLDAIGRRPWAGYGWNQVSVAQAAVAAGHPSTGESLDHSHNLVLDLMIWNGVPLGLSIVGLLAWWFWTHARACREATVAYPLLGVAIVFVHGLLEYPLEYAYFLLPAGLMMGMVEARSPAARFVRVPRLITELSALTTAALMACVIVDYVKIENDGRQARLDNLHLGTSTFAWQVPDVLLLTQLRELLWLTGVEPVRGMTSDQMTRMREAALRFSWSPALLQYAVATGINQQPEVAHEILVLLCKIRSGPQRAGDRATWVFLSDGKYPELKSIVWPETRPAP